MNEGTIPPLSRRSLLRTFLQSVGLGLIGLRSSPLVEAGHVYPARGQIGTLTAHVSRPFNAETPVREFTSWLTPNERFFVRSHFGPPSPELVDPGSWRLAVTGLVDREQKLSLADLKEFRAVTITAVLQCSGNGRSFYRPNTSGVQWRRGAVGNAEWTGVRLRDILERAGRGARCRHVQFQGADRPALPTVPLFIRSIPLEKALHPDTILAYEMNGRPLPLLHGAPLRVITPGWMGDACIKWLTDITLQEEESSGHYMQTAYRMPALPIEPGASVASSAMVPVEAMVVKSLIAAPAEGEIVGRGPVTVQGVAWAGDVEVPKVDVSCDDGKTWQPARFIGEMQPYAWKQWQYVWKAKKPGPTAILCRATDATGTVQPLASPWNPGGFLWNGWDRVSIMVSG
jgi:DMSO/TMAO reductase YedYZ molybdopterin-dependent catalytic subunit